MVKHKVMKMKAFCLWKCILISFTFQLTVYAQNHTQYDIEVQNRINSVENNLRPVTFIEGMPAWKLKDRMQHYHVNGISIAVIKDFKIEWAKGYGLGDSLSGRPINNATLFQVGSISKAVNGLGVLKLVQNGELDLDKDINEYLTSWKFPYDSLSNGKKINLANLLSHTAGLSGHGFPGYEIGDTIPTIIEILNGMPPANTNPIRSQFEPSLKHKYSGGGTTISQLIVQDVTKLPYHEFMQKTIFGPLGMKTSSYQQPPPASNKNLLTSGYRSDGSIVEGNYHIYPEQAAAGLWSNPSELAAYVIEIQQSLIGKSNKILSKEMATKYISPYDTMIVLPYPDEQVALGVYNFKVGSEKYFTHDGSDQGFKAKFIGSIEHGYGAVIMINSDSREILEEVLNAIAFTYKWNNFLNPDKVIVNVNSEILDTYKGNYVFLNNPISIVKEGAHLFLVDGDFKSQLWFTSDTECFIFEDTGITKFTKDLNGKVNGFFFQAEDLETNAPKVD